MAAADHPALASYTPGEWLGVVRSGTVVLLRPDTDQALLDSLWTLLAKAPLLHEVLDAVTAASGGSLARLPWFGIVGLRDSLQVFLRGEIDLEVRLANGTSARLSGRDVTTWAERRFTAAEGFHVAVPGAAVGTAGNIARLPLAEGVVLLQELHCELTGNGTSAAADRLPAAADTAAEPSDHGSSTETVLEFPEEDFAPEPEAPAAEPEPAAEAPAPEPEPEQEPAEQEPTGSYDHLWEQTVMRNIEDAAVREDPDADEEPAPAAMEAGHTEDAGPEPAAEPAEPTVEPGAEPAAEPGPRPAVPSGLIDSVPWSTGGARRADSPVPASLSTAPSSTPSSPAPPSLSASLPRPPADETDHDGQTIMKSALPGRRNLPAAPAGQDPGTGPMVLARVCAQGHANPPTSAQCASCGQALPGDGVQVRRPRLGRMRLSTGELIDLDQSLVVGRQPSVSRVQGAVMPKLIQVASPGGDISRSHVEVRLEGWHVMLCDLKATNGTVLLREGQPPRRLAQGEMAILFDGDVAELGDGVQLRFEELL